MAMTESASPTSVEPKARRSLRGALVRASPVLWLVGPFGLLTYGS